MKTIFFNLIIFFVFIYSCKPNFEKDCDYKLNTFLLKQNKIGKWAIVDLHGNILGYSTRYSTYGFYPYDAQESMTFIDSCSAKGLLKSYENNKYMNQFK